MPGVESTDTPMVPPTSVSSRPSTVNSYSLVIPGSRAMARNRTCTRSGPAATICGMSRLLVAAGALVGLVSVDRPGSRGSAWVVAAPYVTHALVGAMVGLGVALVLARLRPAARGVPPRREAIPERVRHEVWRRDRGTCVE